MQLPGLNKNTTKKAKTLVLTSSVSGEGKTMISINMATVFALSGKKTVLLGMDLRKPKIYDDFKLNNKDFSVESLIMCKTTNKTGIEMEALTAAAVASLTIYDMCKSVDKSMKIDSIMLMHKSGGRSGIFIRK